MVHVRSLLPLPHSMRQSLLPDTFWVETCLNKDGQRQLDEHVSSRSRLLKWRQGDAEGQAQLSNFIDPEAKYPVLVTTSRLLSTGVDVQTCRVLWRSFANSRAEPCRGPWQELLIDPVPRKLSH